MKSLLLLTASVRHEGSASRAAAAHFTSALRASNPGLRVVERDLAARPPAHLTTEWAGAVHTPADKRTPEQQALLAESDAFIAELKAADAVVVATAMYNFGVPSTLKAWIDAVVRSGQTFVYEADGPKGLLTGKRALTIVASAGDYAPGTPAAAIDFASPYLRFVLGFVGISDVTQVPVPNQAGDQRAAAVATAHARLDELARAWSA
jgi:Acyl carrier protein phosphodiesterase